MIKGSLSKVARNCVIAIASELKFNWSVPYIVVPRASPLVSWMGRKFDEEVDFL